jgi:putative methyltransferase
MKKNLYLLELSDVFANQVYLPYCSGVVASYAFSKEQIKNEYELKDWFYYRQPPEDILEKIENPSVVGFSCFIWNWNLNLKIAKELKQKYPECLIVFGGQQQPLADRVGNFFDDHPYVDILVHGEGEETFVEILLEKLKDSPDYSKVSGIT